MIYIFKIVCIFNINILNLYVIDLKNNENNTYFEYNNKNI